ncbi:MAG: hypothetical protein OER96_03070 [Gammaproteobacteria bacterium]|nr:hypothetical protein [Gammaproteobacteria bacterium]
MTFIRSSFIFNSNQNWVSFLRIFVISLVALFVAGYVFILVIDPYDSLPYSIPASRVPVDDQQRFFHPALARNPDFDSAVIGTSNIRLLEPRRLNELLGGSFVNLGMNAASAYEQSRIFDVFSRHHANTKSVIFGIDYIWCNKQYFIKIIPPRTVTDFPEWMYDEKITNDVLPYNGRVLNHAWRQFLHMAKLRNFTYGLDGYTVFTNPIDEYDIKKARRNIYQSEQPLENKPVEPPVLIGSDEIAALEYPAINYLSIMLNQLNIETAKIAIFVPYHYYFQSTPGSIEEIKWNECKRRIADTFHSYNNATVLDFMIKSGITTRDENYWDHKHYTEAVADQLAELIALGVLSNDENPNFRRW